MKWCSLCTDYTPPDLFQSERAVPDGDRDRTVWENDLFRIFPTIGCFVEGYILLVPKKHIPCFGALDAEHLRELLHSLLPEICRRMQSIYGPVCVFEHGVMNEYCRGGGCVDHAHLHIVPCSLNLSSVVARFPGFRPLLGPEPLKQYHKMSIPYLLSSDGSTGLFVCDATRVPSQLFRRIVAHQCGRGDYWNWRTNPFYDEMVTTYNNCKHAFDNMALIDNQHSKKEVSHEGSLSRWGGEGYSIRRRIGTAGVEGI